MVDFKVLEAEYFLDKMQSYELPIFAENLNHTDRNAWEQCRLLMYIVAQTNSRKKLKPSDLINFAWDDEGKREGRKEITDEEISRLKHIAAQWQHS